MAGEFVNPFTQPAAAEQPAPQDSVEPQDLSSTQLLRKATTILNQYGSVSNIPIQSEYWSLMNRYRASLRT